MIFNYRQLHRNLKRRRRLQKDVIILGVVVVAVVAFYIMAPIFFTGPLTGIARPIWNIHRTVSAYLAGSRIIFQSKKELAAENKALQKNAELLALRDIELELLRNENTRLQELLNRRPGETSIAGRVLVRPPVSPYDTFVIDVGSDAGVMRGDLVVAEDVIVGSIVRVQGRTSLAQLFSAPGATIMVSVGSENIPVEAIGKGLGNLSARLPRDLIVKEGDFVTIPSLSTRVFAVVQELRVSPTDPFQSLLFRVPINISTLDFVEIVSGVGYLFDEEEDNE